MSAIATNTSMGMNIMNTMNTMNTMGTRSTSIIITMKRVV